MLELTRIQEKVLEFIRQSIIERQMPPTVHEIAMHMGYRSDNAAYQHLNALERKGAIQLKGHSRGISLLAPSGLPVLGRVAAGTPILAEENITINNKGRDAPIAYRAYKRRQVEIIKLASLLAAGPDFHQSENTNTLPDLDGHHEFARTYP